MTPSGWKRCNARSSDERGAVLVAVLVILLVVMIIFLAVLTYALHRHAQHVKQVNLTAARFLAEAGVQRSLRDLGNGQVFPDKSSRNSPNGGTISTKITAWGPYFLVYSEGTVANQSAVLTALVGSSPPPLFAAATTVCDENYPLVVAGDTRIRGDVNSGPQGLQTGRIRGEGVTTADYHVGEVNLFDELDVPPLDSAVIRHYQREQAGRRSNIDRIEHGSMILSESEHDIFEGGECLAIENDLVITKGEIRSSGAISSIFVGGSAEIAGQSRLAGLIEIVADRFIVVKDSAAVDEALLCAGDSVVLAGNCRFSGIVVCAGKIVVRDSAALVYPSLLLAEADATTEPTGGIFLASSSVLESVCYASKTDTSAGFENCMIFLDTNTTFVGFLVSQGRVDLRGTLLGPVVTEQFHYNLPPTTYVNWLKDCHINRHMLRFNPTLPAIERDSACTGYRILRQDVPTI